MQLLHRRTIYTFDDDIPRENRKKGRELFAEVEPKRYIEE